MALIWMLAALLSVALASDCRFMQFDCSDIYNSGWVRSDIRLCACSGLENLYQLTRHKKFMLRVDLEDFTGRRGFAQYSSFSVGCECEGYKLQVSGFTDGGAGDSLYFHNEMKFSTFDKDQDTHEKNCAKGHLGAFWYAGCHRTNPNGVYLWEDDATHSAIGVTWYTWKDAHDMSLKYISMKIKHLS